MADHRSPAIILHSPQLGENIGAAARVMRNFGLTDLRLVTPRDGWPNQKAVDASSGAVDVIENATLASQRVLTGRLDGLARLIEGAQVTGPALLVIGEVVRRADPAALTDLAAASSAAGPPARALAG